MKVWGKVERGSPPLRERNASWNRIFDSRFLCFADKYKWNKNLDISFESPLNLLEEYPNTYINEESGVYVKYGCLLNNDTGAFEKIFIQKQ